MRFPRVKGEGRSFYHCISRVVEGRFIFGPSEAEQFLSLMRPLEVFSGVRVLTYVLMANHFHLLGSLPGRDGPSESCARGTSTSASSPISACPWNWSGGSSPNRC